MNPYIVKLSIVDDEATLNVSIWTHEVCQCLPMLSGLTFIGHLEQRAQSYCVDFTGLQRVS